MAMAASGYIYIFLVARSRTVAPRARVSVPPQPVGSLTRSIVLPCPSHRCHRRCYRRLCPCPHPSSSSFPPPWLLLLSGQRVLLRPLPAPPRDIESGAAAAAALSPVRLPWRALAVALAVVVAAVSTGVVVVAVSTGVEVVAVVVEVGGFFRRPWEKREAFPGLPGGRRAAGAKRCSRPFAPCRTRYGSEQKRGERESGAWGGGGDRGGDC